MIKLDNETLRIWYLQDLELPDTFHGRTTPKVSRPDVWKRITPSYKSGSPLDLTGRRVWTWSDTHFFHKNIITYAMRPFDSLSDMHDTLIRNYIHVVGPDDIVIWTGDISFGHREEMDDILAALPGHKIQVIGNHDMTRDGKLINYNVDERHISYALHVDRIQLLFTHYPLDNVPKNAVNLHGNIHQNVANSWNFNVSVEHTNYTPVCITDLTDRARTYLESV